MKKYNANNERIKRQYLVFMKEAQRRNESSIDAIIKALSHFEECTRYRDFKSFHISQADAFINHLAEQKPNGVVKS